MGSLKMDTVTKLNSISYFYVNHSEAWYVFMHELPRPCMSLELIKELSNFINIVADYKQKYNSGKFIVISSSITNVFNLGGDIEYFKKLILMKDKMGLLDYGLKCINGLWQFLELSKDIQSIAVVNGSALGGGFELALATNYIIAEENAKLGFPEIKFNLFPGMGAYSFLSRQVGAHLARKIILSGMSYSSEEMYKLGIVDEVAPTGEGLHTVSKYIQRELDKGNGMMSFRRATNYVNPVSYEELLEIVKIWAEACLGLNEKDLKLIDLLVSKQYTKFKHDNDINIESVISNVFQESNMRIGPGLS